MYAAIIIFTCIGGLAQTSQGQTIELQIMSFNVWSAENTQSGRNKLVEIIQIANPDIVAVQEMTNSHGQQTANNLGFFYQQQSSSDIQIISRYPISPFIALLSGD